MGSFYNSTMFLFLLLLWILQVSTNGNRIVLTRPMLSSAMQIELDEKGPVASPLLLPTPQDFNQTSSSSSSPLFFSQTPFLNAGITFVNFNFLRTRKDPLEIAQTSTFDSNIYRMSRFCILDPSKCTVISETEAAIGPDIPTLQKDVPHSSSFQQDTFPDDITKMVMDRDDFRITPSVASSESRGEKDPTLDSEHGAKRENIVPTTSAEVSEPSTVIQYPGSLGEEQHLCTASPSSSINKFNEFSYPRMYLLESSYSDTPGFGNGQAQGENEVTPIKKLEKNTPLIAKRHHRCAMSNGRHAVEGKIFHHQLKKSSTKNKGKKISSSTEKEEKHAPIKLKRPALKRTMSDGENVAEGEERLRPLTIVSPTHQDKDSSKSMNNHDHRKLLAAVNPLKRTMSCEQDAVEVKRFHTLKNPSLMYKEEISYAEDSVRSNYRRKTRTLGYSSHHIHLTAKESKKDSNDQIIDPFKHKSAIDPSHKHIRRPFNEVIMQQLLSDVKLDSWTHEIICFFVLIIFLWIIYPKSFSKISQVSSTLQLAQNNLGIIESNGIEPEMNCTHAGAVDNCGVNTSNSIKESFAKDEDNESFLDGDLDYQIIAHGEELDRCLQELAQFDTMDGECNLSLSSIDQTDAISIASLAATCQDTSFESLDVSPAQDMKEYIEIRGQFNLSDKGITDNLEKKLSFAEHALSVSMAETVALKENTEYSANYIGYLKKEILDLNRSIFERDGKIMTLRGQVISKKHTIASLKVAAQKDIEAQHSLVGSLKAAILSMKEGTKLQQDEMKELRQELAAHTSEILHLQTTISSRDLKINELKDEVMSLRLVEDQNDENFLDLIEETESQRCAIKAYKEEVEQLIMQSTSKSNKDSSNIRKNGLPTLGDSAILRTGKAFDKISITEVNPAKDHSRHGIVSQMKDTKFVNLQSLRDSNELDNTNIQGLCDDKDTISRDIIADLELKHEVEKDESQKAADKASLLEAKVKALTLELQERDRYQILISQFPGSNKSCTSSTISSTLNSPRRKKFPEDVLQKKKEERRARISLRSKHHGYMSAKIAHPMKSISVTNGGIASADGVSLSSCSITSSHKSISEVAGERLYQRAQNRRNRLDDAFRRSHGSPKSGKATKNTSDARDRRIHNRCKSRKSAEKARWRPY